MSIYLFRRRPSNGGGSMRQDLKSDIGEAQKVSRKTKGPVRSISTDENAEDYQSSIGEMKYRPEPFKSQDWSVAVISGTSMNETLFVCVYCFSRASTQLSKAWYRHQDTDQRTCTYPCSVDSASLVYPSLRQEWRRHSHTTHPSQDLKGYNGFTRANVGSFCSSITALANFVFFRAELRPISNLLLCRPDLAVNKCRVENSSTTYPLQKRNSIDDFMTTDCIRSKSSQRLSESAQLVGDHAATPTSSNILLGGAISASSDPREYLESNGFHETSNDVRLNEHYVWQLTPVSSHFMSCQDPDSTLGNQNSDFDGASCLSVTTNERPNDYDRLSSFNTPYPGTVVSGIYQNQMVNSEIDFDTSRTESWTPTMSLVEVVCETFYSLYLEWTQRLALTQDTDIMLAYCPTAGSPHSLLNCGIHAMEGCFNAVFAFKFEDIFALIHLLFAMLKVVYGALDHIGMFSLDVFLWRLAISDTAEILIFIRVWQKLWCPQEDENSNKPKSSLECDSESNPEHQDDQYSSVMDLENLGPGIPDPPASEALCGQERRALISNLVEGRLFRHCIKFFDVLEYSVIMHRVGESLVLNPQNSFISAMMGSVIQPLWQRYDTERIRKHIVNTKARLLSGSMRGVRELEVTLLNYTEPLGYDVDSDMQYNYTQSVAYLCNSVMRPTNLSWRNEYYIADLSVMMRMNFEREAKAPLASTAQSHALTTSRSPFNDHRRQRCDESSPCFVSLGDYTGGLTECSPASLPNNLPKCPKPRLLTEHSSTPWSSRSSTPYSLTTSIATPNNLRCERCDGATFSGTLKSQKRNLRRHNYAVHSGDGKIPCPEVGCRTRFAPARSDNVIRHMKARHHLEVQHKGRRTTS